MLPREHGAWAMLLMPYLLGAAAGWGGWASALLLASILSLFSSSRPLEIVLQNRARRSAIPNAVAGPGPVPVEADFSRERGRQALLRLGLYLGFGGGAGLLLLLLFQRWALLGIAAVSGAPLAALLLLRRRRMDRSWPARLLSIAALSAAGPAAYYAGTGTLDRHAIAAGLIAFLYSGASVFYVRLLHRPPARMKPVPSEESRLRAGRQLLAYLGIAALALGLLIPLGWLPPLASVAFAPLLLKAAWAWRRSDYRPTLRQIGFAEIGHSSLFTLLAMLALASWG